MEPPSGLMSGEEIMEAILRFGTKEEVISELLAIKQLRFEYLIELFRENYDSDLKLMGYYDQSTHPNLVHQFLAQMVRQGHYVITTNFDSLLERAIGLEEKRLEVIITCQDFETFGDPKKM